MKLLRFLNKSWLIKMEDELQKKCRPYLPLFMSGEVIKGFGRGSSELGCPTANFPLSVVQSLPPELECGVYYGWAAIGCGPVHKMVANIGWCPFYNNKEKSVETHVIHYNGPDFYGTRLKIAIVGFLRRELNFNSVDELIQTIKQDIANAESLLDRPDAMKMKDHHFFTTEENGQCD